MTVEAALPILGASGVLSALAMKAPELLKEIYGDLAKPGVTQVGDALKSVLQLGNNIFLPLRLANETARAFEERKFDEIAKRFSAIPEEELLEVTPEVGVPVLERLSYTEDPVLRQMFIELLGKAATASQVDAAHPSFVGVISAISPDEALLIRFLKGKPRIPMVSADAVSLAGDSSAPIYDFIIVPPSDLSFPTRVPFYLSNLIGLGLIEVRRDTWLTAEGSYDTVETHAKVSYRLPERVLVGTELRSIQFKRHLVDVLPYGQSFIEACT